MKKKSERVFLKDYPGSTFYLAQGGIESGLRDGVLVPNSDSSLTLQTAPFDHILTHPREGAEEREDN